MKNGVVKEIIRGVVALGFGCFMNALAGDNPIVIYGMIGYCILKQWDIENNK